MTYRSPRYGEIILILVLGALQPVVELSFGAKFASFYNVAAAVIVISYIAYCLWKYPHILRTWGIRFDTFFSSIPAYIAFAIPAALILCAYAWFKDALPLPASFWYLLALYPLWGFAQQFALQNLLARNLINVFPNVILRSLIVAIIFGLAHVPSPELTVLAAVAGFFFTMIYHKYPNLFVLGITHGIVGALVFYIVLGSDKWAVLMGYVGL